MKYSDTISIQKDSSLSFGSKVTNRLEDEYFDDLSYEELQASITETTQLNKTLSLENGMFEKYLLRNNALSLEKLSQIMDSTRTSLKVGYPIKPMSSAPSLSGSIVTTSLSLREPLSPSNASVRTYGSHRYSASAVGQMRGFKITMEHRIAMALAEIELMQRNLYQFQKSGTKQKDAFKAQVEEIQLRILETNESRERFEVEVVNGAELQNGNIRPEKFKRFVDTWLKSTQSVIDRIRLKTCTIKTEIKKAKQQLIERKVFSKNLQLIDFEQLDIENKNLIHCVNEKNQSLLDMKKTAGHYNSLLTAQKRILAERIAALSAVKQEISTKRDETEQLRYEQVVTKIQIGKAEDQLQHIIELLNVYEVPNVMSLIDIKLKHQDAKQKIKRLKTHRYIQKFSVKSHKHT